MQRLYLIGILVFLVGLTGSTVACKREAPDTRAADAQAIRNLTDVEWLQAAQAKDIDRTVSVWADDVSGFPPNAPVATGKEAWGALWSGWFANPGFSISWQTAKVEVSRASDLAYAHGTYELTLNDPKGKPISDRGKWVAAYKKQPDGSWKVVLGIWNSDQPPAPVR